MEPRVKTNTPYCPKHIHNYFVDVQSNTFKINQNIYDDFIHNLLSFDRFVIMGCIAPSPWLVEEVNGIPISLERRGGLASTPLLHVKPRVSWVFFISMS